MAPDGPDAPAEPEPVVRPCCRRGLPAPLRWLRPARRTQLRGAGPAVVRARPGLYAVARGERDRPTRRSGWTASATPGRRTHLQSVPHCARAALGTTAAAPRWPT